MKITTIGIDLAKNVFQVHGVDEHGKAVFNKPLKREQMAAFFVNLPPCLIGMEACGSAHHWARKLQGMGHTVRLMAPQFVKPYVKTNKNDAADAAAICEAVTRPSMRFVPIKNVEQQGVLALHRVRQGFVKARTAQANQIRGLLAEFGVIVPQGIGHITQRVPMLIEDAANELPGVFRLLIQRLLEHLKELDCQVQELEAQIVAWHRQAHAEHGGLVDVEAIDLVHFHQHHVPGERAFDDARIKDFASRRVEQLGIVEPVDPWPVGVEHHRSHGHGSGERTTTGLVHARHARTLGDRRERKFQRSLAHDGKPPLRSKPAMASAARAEASWRRASCSSR